MSSPTESPSPTPPPLPPATLRPGTPAQALQQWSTDWIATPPPLPQQQAQPQPLPTPNIPFATAPMPVIPLAYAEPSLPMRPTGLVAIGVMSILIGVVSALISGFGWWYLASRYAASVPPAPPAPMAPLPPVNLTPHAGDFVGPLGLKQAERAIVMAAVAQQVTLPADRALLLERFLADIGRDAFGAAPLNSPAAAAQQIRQTGQDQLGRDGTGALGTHFIVTTGGKIALDNAVASFLPAGGGTVVALEGNVLTNERGERTWCAAALDEWIETVGNRPNVCVLTGQQAAVVLEFARKLPAVSGWRGGRYSSDFAFSRVPDELMYISCQGHRGTGIAIINQRHQLLFILPDGRSATSAQAPNGFGPAPDYRPLSPRPKYFAPALPGSLNSIRASIAVETISIALAITLIVAGIRTLAGWRGGAGLHLTWAVVKFAFSFVALAVAIWWSTTVPYMRYASPAWIGKGVGAVMMALLYPGVVFAMMNSAAVRDYYRSIGEPMWLFSPQRRAAWWLEFAEIVGSAAGRVGLWTIGLAAACTAMTHLFAAAYALTDGANGRVLTRVGEHGTAIIFAGGIAAATYWLARWSQQASRTAVASVAGNEGSRR